MPAPGDHLADRYRIDALIGSGGMATVYRAHDERLDRDVAIKVLLPNLAGDPVVAERFEREARSMAAVADPGLVAVFDVDPGDPPNGREPFVVMELCPGGSLADRLGPDRPMPPDELVPILVAIANALATLHRAGLSHRDVKPSNILFADRVKLADFGLVRAGASAGAADGLGDLTEPGTAIGTLAYLAPERLRGEPGGPPADVYALGTVAHLGLTGALPRPSGSVRDVVAAAAFRPPAVSTSAPALGREFDEAVLDALAVDPNRRPDAIDFGAALAAALGRWTRAGRPGAAGPLPVDVATAGARSGAAADDPESEAATTALALPVMATAAIPIEDPAPDPVPAPAVVSAPAAGSPAEGREEDGDRRAGFAWLLPVAAFLAVAFVIGLLGPGLLAGLAGPPGPAASAAAGPASPAVSVSPSASALGASPSPSRDPALAALDHLSAAIQSARGGGDGLKGKERNELESKVAEIRGDLDRGDRAKALRDARELDHRIHDLADHLNEDDARRLESASSGLLNALGG
jgi:Protein kinase domain